MLKLLNPSRADTLNMLSMKELFKFQESDLVFEKVAEINTPIDDDYEDRNSYPYKYKY
jgi:hypothetical protein